MKRSMWARLLAVLLVFSMLPVNASAAMWDNWFNRKPQSSQSSTQKPGKAEKEAAKAEKEAAKAEKEAGKKENKPGKTEKPQTPAKPGKTEKPQTPAKPEKPQAPVKPEKPQKPQKPEKPQKPQKPGQSKPGASEEILVEDASTAENGQLLRAATFTTRAGTATTTVKYFPVTMYDYDEDTINAATDELDADGTTVREGFYFSNGSPGCTTETEVTDMSAFVAGQYYIQNIRAKDNNVDSWLQAHADNKIHGVAKANATVWTLEIEDGKYYLKTQIDGVDNYMIVGTNGDTDGYTTTRTPIEIVAYSHYSQGVQLRQNGYYLCQWGGQNVPHYGGYNVANDTGNGMLFYPVGSDTCIAPTAGETKVVSGYEVWNLWGYNSNDHASQNKAYTGLVQSNLVDDQIVFNVNEGGVFNEDNTVKDIYTYVGLPFVLDTTTGVYTFDSDVNGVYFAGDPQSGTAEAPHNLYFDAGNTQGWYGMYYGDGSTNLWAPFNTNSNDTGENAINYHFGMRADLPFSMTPNGRIQSTNDESDPITFTFKGDDDVWVFIDGHLVIDLGGIHNRLGATVDFAANTVTYFKPITNKNELPIGSHNDPDFTITQKLFTDSTGEGLIHMSREAFALDQDHEMEVFYLERGKGTSNAQIEFNLPMNDTVIVTKDATKSWSQAGEEADLTVNDKDENAGVDDLTAAEQAIVDNIDFGFTLYKKAKDADGFSPVANTNFYLVGRGVDSVIINQTDDKGHFYLKNGQSAKFITEIPADGVTYYVVEDKVPDGFISPDFNFAGVATKGYTYTDGTVSGNVADASQIPEQIIPMPEKDDNDEYVNWPENKSYEVTVSGSIEASDSIEFICSNFLDATLPNPTALAYEDIIVIDYGLPVQIDPLANDVFRGENIEIVYFGDDDVTLTKSNKDGVTEFSWTEGKGYEDFHSGSVTLNDVTYSIDNNGKVTRDTFTYTLNKQLTEVEVISYIIKVTDAKQQGATNATIGNATYAMGKIYIVPATVMYYEEDFSDMVDMVTFTGSGWTGEVSTAGKSDFQEPGVVGTTNDSIYGSDAAYQNDSFDSNGTSYHGDTSNGAIRFTYTFTGTGTTIFARTSATTGYVQIKLYAGTDTGADAKPIKMAYRDTYYKDENDTDYDGDGTLYNIPIYTQEFLDYGTYTVVATVAKAGTVTAGNDTGSGKDFYLDGIRVKQPLNEHVLSYDNEGNPDYDDITDKALGAYATDGESNLDTITLRQKLITDHEQKPDTDAGETETEWPFAVLTDVDGRIVYASDYISIGPKEEVYLNPGQSVSFAIKSWHKDGYRMHMGMKAPFGNATVKVGQTTFNLENAADCYYDITDMQNSVIQEADGSYTATYTFTATDKIVSLTNIKITGNYEFTLVENGEVNVEGTEGEDPAGYLLEKPDEEVTEEETEEETEAPETEDTETEAPETEDTETETPEAEETETETPEAEDTVTETPEAEDTVTETPEAEETETETPEAEETETPEVENTETVTPDIEAASTENTDAAVADVGETDVEA